MDENWDPATAVTQDDLDWWLDLAPTLTWTYAKTMPTVPHEYVVLGRTEGMTKADYVRAWRVIRTFGHPAKFYNRIQIYLEDRAGQWRFWVGLDENPEEADLINRARSADVYGEQNAPVTETGGFTMYDTLATAYDATWIRDSDREEEREVSRMIMSHFTEYAPETLDVGCGTGLLLDLKITSPNIYTGLDPSRGMLNEFVAKHRKAPPRCLIPKSLEQALEDGDLYGQRFDLVCALFAAASYLSESAIERLPELVGDGGMLLAMTYAPGYLPIYYGPGEQPATLEESRKAFERVTGPPVRRIGSFDVWQMIV